MNYTQPKLIEELSRRYVIGLMRGQARARFQGLIVQNRTIELVVRDWEQQLHHLTERLPLVSPSPAVWTAIQQRLFFSDERNSKPNRFWHWLGGVSTAVALLLMVWNVQLTTQPMAVPDRIAVIQSEQQRTLWVLTVGEQQIHVEAQPTVTAQNDRDYELWMLPSDGQAPISLGLLPKTPTTIDLTMPDQFAIANVGALAVSLEPTGGSPTGGPTGPVLYTTDIVTL